MIMKIMKINENKNDEEELKQILKWKQVKQL